MHAPEAHKECRFLSCIGCNARPLIFQGDVRTIDTPRLPGEPNAVTRKTALLIRPLLLMMMVMMMQSVDVGDDGCRSLLDVVGCWPFCGGASGQGLADSGFRQPRWFRLLCSPPMQARRARIEARRRARPHNNPSSSSSNNNSNSGISPTG